MYSHWYVSNEITTILLAQCVMHYSCQASPVVGNVMRQCDFVAVPEHVGRVLDRLCVKRTYAEILNLRQSAGVQLVYQFYQQAQSTFPTMSVTNEVDRFYQDINRALHNYASLQVRDPRISKNMFNATTACAMTPGLGQQHSALVNETATRIARAAQLVPKSSNVQHLAPTRAMVGASFAQTLNDAGLVAQTDSLVATHSNMAQLQDIEQSVPSGNPYFAGHTSETHALNDTMNTQGLSDAQQELQRTLLRLAGQGPSVHDALTLNAHHNAHSLNNQTDTQQQLQQALLSAGEEGNNIDTSNLHFQGERKSNVPLSATERPFIIRVRHSKGLHTLVVPHGSATTITEIAHLLYNELPAHVGRRGQQIPHRSE